jgi:hypothetical protein
MPSSTLAVKSISVGKEHLIVFLENSESYNPERVYGMGSNEYG